MDNSQCFAGQLGINSLYHYQDFNLRSSDDHIGWLTEILKNHRIRCSDPANFNDPWDGKPYFDPAHLNDPLARAATAEAITGTGGLEVDRMIAEVLRTNPEVFRAAMHDISVELPSFISSNFGVYCLSPDPCLPLMWSHYARSHQGICLEFAVPNTKFVDAVQVQYQKEYPALSFHDPERGFKMLLFKSDDWMYEREFRLICHRLADVKDAPLLMDGNYLSIGPTDLTSIIMGCQIIDAAARTIRDLVQEHAPHVKVLQAQRAIDKYQIVIGDP
jgi:hypothetical protein